MANLTQSEKSIIMLSTVVHKQHNYSNEDGIYFIKHCRRRNTSWRWYDSLVFRMWTFL